MAQAAKISGHVGSAIAVVGDPPRGELQIVSNGADDVAVAVAREAGSSLAGVIAKGPGIAIWVLSIRTWKSSASSLMARSPRQR